jgi:hypothetical protein
MAKQANRGTLCYAMRLKVTTSATRVCRVDGGCVVAVGQRQPNAEVRYLTNQACTDVCFTYLSLATPYTA